MKVARGANVEQNFERCRTSFTKNISIVWFLRTYSFHGMVLGLHGIHKLTNTCMCRYKDQFLGSSINAPGFATITLVFPLALFLDVL